jgi:hypothetical protein
LSDGLRVAPPFFLRLRNKTGEHADDLFFPRSQQSEFGQDGRQPLRVEASQLPIPDHDQRYAATAQLKKLLLDLSRFADIEVQKRNIVFVEPPLGVPTMGAI